MEIGNCIICTTHKKKLLLVIRNMWKIVFPFWHMHITYPAYVFPLFAVPSYLTIGKDNI